MRFVRDALADAAKRGDAVSAAIAENQQIRIFRGNEETVGRLALVELEVLNRAEFVAVERLPACRDFAIAASCCLILASARCGGG